MKDSKNIQSVSDGHKGENLHISKCIGNYADCDSKAKNSPLFGGGICAGFPSPADDYMEMGLDLNDLVVQHRASTFYAKVVGESMIDAGLNDGDILVIDKSIEAQDGKIAVCFIDGDFTVKRIEVKDETVWLMPANKANKKYKPIKVNEDANFIIWGIVTYVIKKL